MTQFSSLQKFFSAGLCDKHGAYLLTLLSSPKTQVASVFSHFFHMSHRARELSSKDRRLRQVLLRHWSRGDWLIGNELRLRVLGASVGSQACALG